MGKAIEITDANYEEIVASGKPVLIDFWAVWCGPCKAIAPIIEELAGDFADKVIVGKLDVDNNPKTAMKYGIMNIPTLVFLDKKGNQVEKMIGGAPKSVLAGKLTALDTVV